MENKYQAPDIVVSRQKHQCIGFCFRFKNFLRLSFSVRFEIILLESHRSVRSHFIHKCCLIFHAQNRARPGRTALLSPPLRCLLTLQINFRMLYKTLPQNHCISFYFCPAITIRFQVAALEIFNSLQRNRFEIYVSYLPIFISYFSFVIMTTPSSFPLLFWLFLPQHSNWQICHSNKFAT